MGCSPSPAPPSNFGPKRCLFSKLVPNYGLCTKFGTPYLFLQIASMVAEISRGSQIFLDALLAQTPANFGPKCRFFGKLVPNPICVPNLKLLASTVAKIRRGSQIFLDVPL